MKPVSQTRPRSAKPLVYPQMIHVHIPDDIIHKYGTIATTPLGKRIGKEAAEKIGIEFKAFMKANAIKIRNDPQRYMKEETKGGGGMVVFRAVYRYPGPVLDSLWQYLVLNAKMYEKMCMELVGGFIDRDVNSCNREMWIEYKKLRNKLGDDVCE